MDGAPIWRMAIMRGRDRLYHGLDTEERDRRRDRDKMRDAAIGFLLVLRRRAKPDLAQTPASGIFRIKSFGTGSGFSRRIERVVLMISNRSMVLGSASGIRCPRWRAIHS